MLPKLLVPSVNLPDVISLYDVIVPVGMAPQKEAHGEGEKGSRSHFRQSTVFDFERSECVNKKIIIEIETNVKLKKSSEMIG